MAVDEPPDRHVCPITQEVMRDPVMDREGHNFEKEAIEAWLDRHPDCPMGREPLQREGLFPNRALREEILEAQARRTGGPPAATEASPPVAVSSTLQPTRSAAAPPSADAPPWAQYGIGQEEYDHALCQFITFDLDGSGTLDSSECQRLCRYLNYPSRDADVRRMLEVTGAKDDRLNFHEFMGYMQSKRPKPELLYGMSTRDYEHFMMQFSSNDHNGDGLLDQEELLSLCRAQGYPHSPDMIARLTNCMESAHAGTIDAHEFLTFMRYNDPRKVLRTAVPTKYADRKSVV